MNLQAEQPIKAYSSWPVDVDKNRWFSLLPSRLPALAPAAPSVGLLKGRCGKGVRVQGRSRRLADADPEPAVG